MRLDKLTSDYTFLGPVSALDQNVRLYLLDQFERIGLVEHDNIIDHLQSRKNRRAVVDIIDRPVGALELLNGRIAVESQNDNIALVSAELQLLGMPAMENVEAAVCEDNGLVLVAVKLQQPDE